MLVTSIFTFTHSKIQAEMLISKSNIVYFHDLENDYYTLEHPLTQRYLKVLVRLLRHCQC